MDAENGNDDVEDEVECDEELIEGARLACEETVHDPVECDRDCILGSTAKYSIQNFPRFRGRFRSMNGQSRQEGRDR